MNEGGDPVTVETPASDPSVGKLRQHHALVRQRPARSPTRRPDGARQPLSSRSADFSAFYGTFRAIRDIDMDIPPNRITALIGPSGCGKSTLLRWLNRMNDLVPGAHMQRRGPLPRRRPVRSQVDPVEVRRRIGMVFQKPNPFPKSIYDNVAFGPRVAGYKGNMDELVEESLRRAAIWDEVKDKLKQPGTALSGGQQQRLCIARAIAVQPDVILMDEPCSALDPVATLKIEELMFELSENYTIVIVTHNMQQAARASDETVFLTMGDDRAGYLVENGPDERDLHQPQEPADRGLRLRSVRLRSEDRTMQREVDTGRRSSRATERRPRSRPRAGRPHHRDGRLRRRSAPARVTRHARPRGARDQGRRPAHGQPRRGPDLRSPSRRSSTHDADRGDWRSSSATGASTRRSAHISASSRGPSRPSSRSRATCASCSRSTTWPTTSSGWATTPRRSPSRRASWRP